MVRRPGRAVDDAVACLLSGPGDEPVQVQLGRPGHAEGLEQDRVAARLRRDAGFAALGSRGATPASSRGAARVAGVHERGTCALHSVEKCPGIRAVEAPDDHRFQEPWIDRKSTRLIQSLMRNSDSVFCLKTKKEKTY